VDRLWRRSEAILTMYDQKWCHPYRWRLQPDGLHCTEGMGIDLDMAQKVLAAVLWAGFAEAEANDPKGRHALLQAVPVHHSTPKFIDNRVCCR